jgi:hypothetical protein
MTNTSGGVDVFASGSLVVVALARSVRTCTADCALAAATWTTFPLPTANHDAHGLCGTSASDVWLTATNGQGDGELFHYDGMSWVFSGAINLRLPSGCWFDGATLNVAGSTGVLRGGQFELVEGNGILFQDGASVGGQTWVVGADRRIAKRQANGTWQMVSGPATQAGLFTIGGPTTNELWALGTAFSDGISGSSWNGSSWRDVPPWPGFGAQSTIRSMVVTSPTEVWFAGGNTNIGPAIVRAAR